MAQAMAVRFRSAIASATMSEAPAQASGGMGARKILAREAARLEQRHRQRVTHGERRRGARGWSEVMRTGFFFHADVKDGVRLPREA